MQPQQGALDLQPDVPFTRNHASYLAALKLSSQPGRRHVKAKVYLSVLSEGAKTDREAYDAMAARGCKLAGVSSVCSIRNGAMTFGLVERGEIVPGPFGTPNCRFQLTEAGRAVTCDASPSAPVPPCGPAPSVAHG